MAANSSAGGAPLDKPAPPARRRYNDWAHQVGDLLAAALARDDERRRILCPRCGRPLVEVRS